MSYRNFWIDRRRALFKQYVHQRLQSHWPHVYSESLLLAVVADLIARNYDLFDVSFDDIDVAVVHAQP